MIVCDKLEKVIIPNSVTNIYYGAFRRCYNLNQIIFDGTMIEWRMAIMPNWNGDGSSMYGEHSKIEVVCTDGILPPSDEKIVYSFLVNYATMHQHESWDKGNEREYGEKKLNIDIILPQNESLKDLYAFGHGPYNGNVTIVSKNQVNFKVDNVFVEYVEGGLNLYFVDANGAKQYMGMVVNDTHINAVFDKDKTVFTYNEELQTVVGLVDGKEYVFGTRNDNTYTTIGANALSYNPFMVTFVPVGGEAPHEHNFVEGKCECGEVDPNYVPAHKHEICPECGKCLLEDCDGEKCTGHEVEPEVAEKVEPLTYDSDIEKIDSNEVIENEIKRLQNIINETGLQIAKVKPTKQEKEYNEFIKQFELVGSNVLFLRKDGYVETVSTGHASLENNILSHPNSIYRIASISKVIVAVGLLKLYEKGLVDLDGEYFYDGGSVKVANAKIKCWKSGGHGSQNFLQVVQKLLFLLLLEIF